MSAIQYGALAILVWCAAAGLGIMISHKHHDQPSIAIDDGYYRTKAVKTVTCHVYDDPITRAMAQDACPMWKESGTWRGE